MQVHPLRVRLLHHRRFRQMLTSSLILSLFIAIIIVPVEKSSSVRQIDSFSDGLWWAVQTVTTVGYGDVVPVTEVGRFLGILLQILGAMMFGSLIAIISSSMNHSKDEMYWNRLFNRLDNLTGKIERIEQETRYIVKSDVEVEKEKPPLK